MHCQITSVQIGNWHFEFINGYCPYNGGGSKNQKRHLLYLNMAECRFSLCSWQSFAHLLIGF